MTEEAVQTDLPVEVPFYERAAIRPRELAELRGKLKQACGEVDYFLDLTNALLAALGFDHDWATQQGVKDALKDIQDIAAGKMTREEFGDIRPGTVVAVIFDLRYLLNRGSDSVEIEKKGRVYPLREERKGQK